MNKFIRLITHLVKDPWYVSRSLSKPDRREIQKAVHLAEQKHSGQIKVVVEGALDAFEILRGMSPLIRARQIFCSHHVWDTEHNNGVLLYLLLADHAVVIVADRGLNSSVTDANWQEICQIVKSEIKATSLIKGILLGVEQIKDKLCKAFPSERTSVNELPDEVTLLR